MSGGGKPQQGGTEVLPPLTPIAEYTATAAALAKLEETYKGVIYDVTTKEGLAAAIKGRAELRGLRVALERTRVEIKAPALKRAREIDSEAHRITDALLALETPIDDQIKADERRKEAEAQAKLKAEQDRIAAEEAERRATEERVRAAQREEIERQQRELAERQRVQAEAEAAARKRIEDDQRAAQAVIDAANREAQRQRDEADRIAKEARDKAEAEAKAKRDAEEREAREKREAEERRLREAQEKIDAEKRAVEEAARKARLEQEERERKEREVKEAAEREERRQVQEKLDARAALENFRERFGKLPEFAGVVKAIDAYLKEQKK